MALSDDLINFDLIETHKENIQSLPGGRSARQLASILSPLSSGKSTAGPGLDETKTLNDAIRQEYEIELQSIDDSDDPLDIYDRYVKWTLNAYPSAQATPQSQLLPLLERATKTFLTSSHYKNDPRYLKLWLHYIRLFSDAPRETFAFLARHNIGEGLGLFYEEFAAWLEGAGRWNQADEVYKMGIEREARPAERLMRKYNQFQQRYEARSIDANEPSSPALPKVRAALAAKIDPFASTTTRTEDALAQPQRGAAATGAAKPKKQKMAIFSDADSEAPPPAANSAKGWDSIGSMRERKKENTIEARPWAGETLKAGKRVGTAPKMEIFKDPNSQSHESKKVSSTKASTDVINPRTGRAERVFVKIEAVYPNSEEEFSFEELRAMSRGWANRDWRSKPASPMRPVQGNVEPPSMSYKSTEPVDVENLSHNFQQKVDINDNSTESMTGIVEGKPVKAKRMKVREVKQETQTVKLRLESPTGPKIRRKGSSEPTMTFHSKAATNDIYDMFNQSRKIETKDDTQSGDETDYGDDTYSVAGESTGTGRISGNNSEYEDDTLASARSFGEDNTSSVSPWSDFTASKHMPKTSNKAKSKNRHRQTASEDLTDNMDSSQDQTQNGFDTQAIAAIANQDLGDFDTKMIAQLAGDDGEEDEEEIQKTESEDEADEAQSEVDSLKTPIEPLFPEQIEVHSNTRYLPLPPEDYEPTPLRPFRDPAAAAQNKLPFMTPIVERTESSLAPSTIFNDKDYFNSKTPSRSVMLGNAKFDSPSKLQVNDLLLESPQNEGSAPVKRKILQVEVAEDENVNSSPPKKFIVESPVDENQKIPFAVTKPLSAPTDLTVLVDDAVFKTPAVPKKQETKTRPIHKGPIVLDLQCNPCDSAIRDQILQTVHPAPSSYDGYYDNSTEISNQYPQMRSYADKVAKQKNIKASPRKGQNEKALTKAIPPMLKFAGTSRTYAVKRELGKGAFAPVYLVDSCDASQADETEQQASRVVGRCPSRGALEALKTESPPLTLTWEFHILHLLRSRLGTSSRSMESIITAHECHLYRDECYLVLDYHSQGTLLDLVNLVRGESVRAGKPAEGLEEPVAMWLGVELLRSMEDVHKVGILHGDLKADNCLVRFDAGVDVSGPYDRYGGDGWNAKGLLLIDFGRGIDTKAFKPEARFVADWKAEETDCAEIREARPWKWEIDLFGAAGVIHSLLFGKYIETVSTGGGGLGQKKDWKLKEGFKRYWEREIWGEVFAVLLNGSGKPEDVVRKEVGRVRGLMEDWLEKEGERSGRDLRGGIRRCERLVAGWNIKGKGR